MIPRRPVLFILLFLFTGLQSNAQLVFKAAFMAPHPMPDCYKLYWQALRPDTAGTMVLISEGEAFQGTISCLPAKKTIVLTLKSGCGSIQLHGMTFTTGSNAQVCLNELIFSEGVDDALLAAVDNCVAGIVDSTKVIKAPEEGLLVWPQPAHHYLNIAAGFKGVHEAAWLIMNDEKGREVFRVQLQNVWKEAFTIGLKDYRKGNYMLLVRAGSKVMAQQLIKIQ